MVAIQFYYCMKEQVTTKYKNQPRTSVKNREIDKFCNISERTRNAGKGMLLQSPLLAGLWWLPASHPWMTRSFSVYDHKKNFRRLFVILCQRVCQDAAPCRKLSNNYISTITYHRLHPFHGMQAFAGLALCCNKYNGHLASTCRKAVDGWHDRE